MYPGENQAQALGFIAKAAGAFGHLFFQGIMGVDVVHRADARPCRRDPDTGLGQNLAQPQQLCISGLAALIGAGQNPNAAVVPQVHIVGDDVGRAAAWAIWYSARLGLYASCSSQTRSAIGAISGRHTGKLRLRSPSMSLTAAR